MDTAKSNYRRADKQRSEEVRWEEQMDGCQLDVRYQKYFCFNFIFNAITYLWNVYFY